MTITNRKMMLFDLDGTLVDTAPDFRNSVNHMLEHYNEPPVTLEEIRDWVGYGGRELIKRTMLAKKIAFDDAKLDTMLELFLSHYTKNIDDDSKLYNNVKETLVFFLVSLINLTRQIFIDTARDERNDKVIIREKLNVVSGYIENTKNGSRNKNSEIIISGMNSKKKNPVAIKM